MTWSTINNIKIQRMKLGDYETQLVLSTSLRQKVVRHKAFVSNCEGHLICTTIFPQYHMNIYGMDFNSNHIGPLVDNSGSIPLPWRPYYCAWYCALDTNLDSTKVASQTPFVGV